uniref:PLA2c domain-containing protein n=1 Tax=Sander lucioperca TaxID=283035 RepID=A0A8C9ZCY1_SANLU
MAPKTCRKLLQVGFELWASVLRNKLLHIAVTLTLSPSCFQKDSVPHIALLASGGGQRAAVGLVGSLYQMEKEHLLDTLLYLGSVSGSTWSMSSIYSDPQWSDNLDTAVSRLSGPGVPLEEALAWLGERAKEEHFSLSDVWGVLTSTSRKATNPYPIYNAIEKYCYSHGPIQGKWFEVTPHEAGFTELGLFIKTSLLGSKFQNGKLLVKKPEMDMVKLQGVCSQISLLTNLVAIKNLFKFCCWADSTVPPYLRSTETFHPIDAGLLINVGYPSFLGEKRYIDLIIAPEYSAGNMFEVQFVCVFSRVPANPFGIVQIDAKILEEKDWPKGCYVLKGKEKEPTIVYMPLFNRHNCKGLLHTHMQIALTSVLLCVLRPQQSPPIAPKTPQLQRKCRKHILCKSLQSFPERTKQACLFTDPNFLQNLPSLAQFRPKIRNEPKPFKNFAEKSCSSLNRLDSSWLMASPANQLV